MPRRPWRKSSTGGAPIGSRAAPAFCSPTRSVRRSAFCRLLDAGAGPLVFHEPVERINAIYRGQGIALPLAAETSDFSEALILASPARPGVGMASPFRSRLHRLCLGLDAHSGSAPPPLAGSRLRALRSRRLARPPSGHRADRRRDGLGHPRLHRASGPLAGGTRQAGGCRGIGVAREIPKSRRRPSRRPVPNEGLRRTLRRTRPDHQDQRQGRRAQALPVRRPARGRRLGRQLPDRPPPQAAPGIAQARAMGHRRGRRPRLAVRRVLPRGRRFRGDHRPSPAARRRLQHAPASLLDRRAPPAPARCR